MSFSENEMKYNEAETEYSLNMVLPSNINLIQKNFFWTFFGNVAYAAAQWGTIIVLAKYGSPLIVGRFSLSFAITAPIFMLMNLNLRSVLATDATSQFQPGQYIGFRIISSGIALTIVTIIILVINSYHAFAGIIVAVAIAKAIESVSDIIYGVFQKNEFMKPAATSMFIKGMAMLAVIWFVIVITKDLFIATLSIVFVWATVLLMYDLPKAKSQAPIRPTFSFLIDKQILTLALPLGIVAMLGSLCINIPRYFIEGMHGEEQLGYFSALAYFMLAGNMVIGSLGQAAIPRLARYYAGGNIKEYVHLLGFQLGMGFIIGLLGVGVSCLMGNQIITILYKAEYTKYAQVLNWLMVAAGLGYISSFLGYSLTSARHFKSQIPLNALMAVSLTGACLILIPKEGIYGAAKALVISSIIQIIGYGIINARIINRLKNERILENNG